MESPASADYKGTLNLPQTDFAMRAGLPAREPEQVARWIKDRIYYRMVEKARKRGKGRFVLHDGPPYANGDIHIGHALDKTLKDIVVKYHNMSGHESPYIPGWDCHGLPIELGVEKQLLDQKRDKASVPVTELRALCRNYAQKYIDLQMSQFQRLEVFGDWEHPYATMQPEYEAEIIRSLGRVAKAGYLYKGNKPVYWCPNDATALAEAEIEYADKQSPSITVKFDLTNEALAAFPELAAAAKKAAAVRTALLIWTTTPWTLPANLGISLHPEFDYVAIKVPAIDGTEIWIVAKDLQESVEKSAGFEKVSTPLLTFKAEKLHKQKARHPFIDRDSLILLGDHVTADAGTGAVHTAPGHGVDDYRIGSRYGLEIYAPVDDRGRFTDQFPDMKGQFVFKANEAIIERLKASGHLVARVDITHSYPHCWRCHKPVIFRATPQWFIGMELRGSAAQGGMELKPDGALTLRQKAEKAIHEVKWIPDWGINRILGMIESRPDWCISRQRIWGVPITVFYCEGCAEPLADQETFFHVADVVEKRGIDTWFTDDAAKLVPPGAKCKKCAGTAFRKERDILDVWFESGVSHAAVCERRGLGWPAELYLEGSDQHRGWFQTSLLTAVATRGRAPYLNVLTHGFVNDKEGKKMSKSKGNSTSPLDIMKTHGAEILRLWTVLEDYRNDVNFSMESLERVSETYRKIRNTVRFLLSNLYDFEPARDARKISEMGELDRWALSRAAEWQSKIHAGYESYEYHQVYHSAANFCAVDLSAVYFDILKDRLYTAGKNSKERRSSQTAMWMIASALIRSLAPILSFTAEEAWTFMPKAGREESVLLEEFPTPAEHFTGWRNAALEERYAGVWQVRDVVLKALEEARRAKTIGHPREARVKLAIDAAAEKALGAVSEDLARLFLVSELELVRGQAAVSAEILVAPGTKCARCWVHSRAVGQSKAHPDLCDRCVEALA